MNKNDLAPCGIDCVNCEMFAANGRSDVWERVATMLGKTPEDVKCKGCREQGGCSIHGNCKTLACVMKKGLESCHLCESFPCTYLLPMADRANNVPHNMKVFNLCRIRLLGEEGFLREAKVNRQKYYTGKFLLGAGPQLPNS